MVSEQLERWLNSDGEKTLGSLIGLFQEKSFAILFVLLLGVPALPLPTGGRHTRFRDHRPAARPAADSRPQGDLAAPALVSRSSWRGTNSSAFSPVS